MHGIPDWGLTAAKKTIHGLADLGELAARLGSPDVYDRRGDVVLVETFPNGLAGWGSYGLGTGHDAFPVADPVLDGAIAIVLRTGDTTNNFERIGRCLQLPVSGRLGFEFSHDVYANLDSVRWFSYVYTSGTMYTYAVRYNHVAGAVEVLHSDGSWYAVGSPGDQGEEPGLFHTIKLVASTEEEKYIRVLFDSHTYDASSFAPQAASTTEKDSMCVYLYVYTAADVSIDVTIDRIILTQNEP